MKLQWLAVLCICSATLAFNATAQQPMRVASNGAFKHYHPAIAALYKEVGLEATFVDLPRVRGLMALEAGDVDADLGRFAGASASFKNIIVTTEPLIEVSIVPYLLNSSPLTKLPLADLKGISFGYVRGSRVVESLLSDLKIQGDPTSNFDQLFLMLDRNRFDVALVASVSHVPSGIAPRVRTLKPLLTAQSFHVLHVRWSNYAPKIDAALRNMKADGRWSKLLQAAE